MRYSRGMIEMTQPLVPELRATLPPTAPGAVGEAPVGERRSLHGECRPAATRPRSGSPTRPENRELFAATLVGSRWATAKRRPTPSAQKWDGQPGQRGAFLTLPPVERVAEVEAALPEAGRHCRQLVPDRRPPVWSNLAASRGGDPATGGALDRVPDDGPALLPLWSADAREPPGRRTHAAVPCAPHRRDRATEWPARSRRWGER